MNKIHLQTNTCHILTDALISEVCTKGLMCCGKRKQWLANPMEQCNGKLARTKKLG